MSRTKETSGKEVPITGLNLDFSKSPVSYDVLQSQAVVQRVMWPVGAGKA